MIILGLGHRARQGKDLVASYLSNHYGYKIYHFADSLKKECKMIFDWHDGKKNVCAQDAVSKIMFKQAILCESLGAEVEVEKDPQNEIPIGLKVWGNSFPFGGDSLLQYWAELRRFRDQDYWIKSVFTDIASECRDGEKVVISDLRYLNEMQWIKLFGTGNVRIRRILPDGHQYIDPFRNPDHISECGLDNAKFDLSIDISNATSIEQMMTNIAEASKKIIESFYK